MPCDVLAVLEDEGFAAPADRVGCVAEDRTGAAEEDMEEEEVVVVAAAALVAVAWVGVDERTVSSSSHSLSDGGSLAVMVADAVAVVGIDGPLALDDAGGELLAGAGKDPESLETGESRQ